MIKLNKTTGTLERTGLPEFLIGLSAETLLDLSWTDPALGVNDCAWLPEVDQSPQLGQYERYSTETLTLDQASNRVIVVRAVVPWTAEEIAEFELANKPTRRITRLAFRNRFTLQEKVALEIAQLDNPSASMQDRAQSAALRASQADLSSASFVDLDRTDTRSGVMMLESAGLLAVGRALEILDAEITQDERPSV